ncbi:UDP-N-acetylglucosamine transferase subunit ALG14 homolog [Linum grandiflorum]
MRILVNCDRFSGLSFTIVGDRLRFEDMEMHKEHDCCHSTATVIAIFILMVVVRVVCVLYWTGKPLSSKSSKPRSTLIVLGSGGHTAEMIDIVSGVRKDRFTPRFYIAAATDNMSLQKARVLEDSLVDAVLCNGPGTCIPLCMIAFLFKVMGIRWSSIFYVESIARVKKLSLSGLLLYKLHIADQFFVQWPQLQKKYPRAHYVGCLM